MACVELHAHISVYLVVYVGLLVTKLGCEFGLDVVCKNGTCMVEGVWDTGSLMYTVIAPLYLFQYKQLFQHLVIFSNARQLVGAVFEAESSDYMKNAAAIVKEN